MDWSFFANVPITLVIGGLIFIFVSKMKIGGKVIVEPVDVNNANSIYNIGVLLVVFGVISYGVTLVINADNNPSTSTTTPTTTPTTTTYTNTTPYSYPSAEFKKIWFESNVTEKGEIGMKTHVDFNIYNLKGENCWVNEYFSYANGTELKDINDGYSSTTNQVATWKRYTPMIDNDTYTDFSLFIPYSELHLSKGTYELSFYIEIQQPDSLELVTSDDYTFSYTQS